MRVLHVYRTYYPDAQGGLQESIRQICLASSNYGVQSKIFALSPNPNPTTINAEEGLVVRSRSWWAPASCDMGGIDALNHFNELAEWSDLIHFHYPWPFADLLYLFSKTKKPTVLTYHSDIVKQKTIDKFYAPLRKYMLNSMGAIVATSPIYAHSSPVLKTYHGSLKLRIIPLGIIERENSFNCPYQEDAYLETLHLQRKPYLLFLGVLRYYKGLHTLVQAAKDISCTVIIAGSGPQEDVIKKQSAALGVTNISFIGEVTELQKSVLLKHCQALILPSHVRSEAFGMVLIEAAMHSKPMICCEISSGTSFVNINDSTGYVIEPENPAQLAKAANAILANPTQAKIFGQNARKRYENLFSGDALGKAYSKLYKEVVNHT